MSECPLWTDEQVNGVLRTLVDRAESDYRLEQRIRHPKRMT